MSEELEPRVRNVEEDIRTIKKSITIQDVVHNAVLADLKEQGTLLTKLDKKLDAVILQIAEAKGFWAASRIWGAAAAASIGAGIASVWAFFKDGP